MAMQLSALYDLLQEDDGKIKKGNWVSADEAYFCTMKLLTPWPVRSSDAARDCFNYRVSSTQISIEHAFGVLVG